MGQDGVVQLDIIWERIQQCFRNDEEAKAKKIITKNPPTRN